MILFRLSLVTLLVVAVSAQTDTSRDALFAAIQRGAAGEVAQLLRNGVSPNLVDAGHSGPDGGSVVCEL